MMYRLFLIFFVVMLAIGSQAQQRLTLDECLAATMKNHPLSQQNNLYTEANDNLQKNIDNGKLPQLSANGQATYQNEVIQLLFSMPGAPAPVIPKAQYKMSLDANQLIYGGGNIDAQAIIEDFNRQINLLNNDAELYKIRERINQLYFSILLADLNAGVIKGTIEDLDARLAKVSASVKWGVLLPSAAEILEAEKLKGGQRLLEVKTQKRALVNTLKVLSGMEMDENTLFVEPGMDIDLSVYANRRPEFGVFGLMQQKMEAAKKLSIAKEMPRIYGFGTAGYGNPGYNFFKEGAAFFYTVGAKVSWNFWNWHQTSREKQILDINSSIIENQKNAYDLANKAQVQQYLADIQKADELIKSDEEIIRLRKSITLAAASQLENGTITATEFVTEQIAGEQALLAQNLHKMQLLQSKALYKAATGGL